jgi:NAD(P)-dependent dehydrogenase (short-subunit alcohol dehydrogenase family)
MLALPTFEGMKLTEKTILVTGVGRGRTEAFHALGHKVIIAGRREEVLDQTTDADPGTAFVTLDQRRPGCASEMINSLSCPGESLGLLNRMRKFFAGFATAAEGPGHGLSSVTTPNGPWVYTAVPWED